MKVIIASTYEDYRRCCDQRCLNHKEVPWITEPAQIEKIHESVQPIYFGAVEDTPKYREIERIMRSKGILVKGQHIYKRSEVIDLDNQ